MANERILNIPVGGLDSDSENRLVDFKDYRYGLNLRNGIAYIKKLGGATNVKGNNIVPKVIYSYTDTLPSGKNKCIGTYEDKQNGTLIFFVWNSNDNHQIFRYYPDITDGNNPHGEIHQICVHDFGWKSWTKITSIDLVAGKLLYWTDNVHSRKLNIEKAELVNKHKKWVAIYPVTNQFTTTGVIGLGFVKAGVGQTITLQLTQTYDTTEEALTAIATKINQQAGQYFTAEACNCKVEITEKGTDIKGVTLTGFRGKTSPENYYGEQFIERYVNLVKNPPNFNPIAFYRKDTSKKYNYVKNKVFQCRLQYVYDDNEKSALSPISQIAYGNDLVNQAQADTLNYIDINFNNADVTIAQNWTLLKRVIVFVREHNEGVWREVADLDICEIYDYQNSQEYFHYKFYNDVNSKGVDTALQNKLYDDVPLHNYSQKYVKNRLVMAGLTQNYDAPECIEAHITQEFETGIEEKYDITAKIRIFNPTYNGNAALNLTSIKQIKGAIVKHPKQEGIFDVPVWGGLATQYDDTQTFGSTFGKNQGIDYEQWLPAGGFTGFLAGTDFLGISVQTTDNAQVTPSVIGNGKAFDTSDMLTTKEWIVNKPYEIPNEDSALVKLMIDDNADVYSELTIKGVPNGVYVLRLASHWVSDGDVLDKGSMYNLNNRRAIQKTSTNVRAVKPANGVLTYNEFEIKVEVNGGNVYAGEFYVEDLTCCYNYKKNDAGSTIRPRDLNYSGYRFSVGATGYVVDNDGEYDDADLKVAIAMEKQYVNVAVASSFKSTGGQPVSGFKIPISWKTFVATDHNGYYCCALREDNFSIGTTINDYAISQGSPPPLITITIPSTSQMNGVDFKDFGVSTRKAFGLDIGGSVILINSLKTFSSKSVLKDIFTGGLSPQTIIGNSQGYVGCGTMSHTQFLVPCVNVAASRQLKTFITGNVIDSNGDGFAGVTAVFTGTGRYAVTDADGEWVLPIYANSIITSGAAGQRTDFTLYYLAGFQATFTPNDILSVILDIGITWTTTNWYTTFLNPSTITIDNNLYGKSHKRGGNYIYALRYYDYGGRLCSVVTAPNLNIYIPFITEDLNKVLPDQYTTPNTYKNGKVKLQWHLDSRPPRWAYTYQWMRTLDNHYAKYLSWVTNSVKYISKTYLDEDNPEVVTSYSNGDATNIMIDISNLADYKRRYPDSSVGYEYQVGDKIRLIRNENGEYYKGLFEYEVVSYQETGSYLIVKNDVGAPEIKAGCQIEIFRKRILEDEKGQIFYEVGECYKCTQPDSDFNEHSVTSAYFTNGDTYWRNRIILTNDTVTGFTGTYNYIFESQSISDFYSSEDSDIGRIGVINKDFVQQFRPTLHIVSNIFIPDTQVNGLSNYEALNTKELDRQYGVVNRLVFVGETLYSICENKIVSNYVNRRVLSESGEDTGVVSIADTFLGTDRATEKDYGTQHAESVVVQDNSVYGVDVFRGLVWRHAENGTIEISAINYRAFFKELLKDGMFDVFAGIDRYYNEYIITATKAISRQAQSGRYERGRKIKITFASPINVQVGDTIDVSFYDNTIQQTVSYRTNVLSVNGSEIIVELPEIYKDKDSISVSTIVVKYKGDTDTIAWSEEKNRWVTHYSYKPENYGIIGMKFVSFVDGNLWIHDTNNLRNNFYGVQYSSKITPVFVGENASQKKIWMVAKLEQYQLDQRCNWFAPVVQNDYNQLSRLAKTFVKKEEHWSNPFKRDLNDVTVPVNSRILNGRMMRSSNLTVEFENDYTSEFTLRAMVAEYDESKQY